MSFNVINLFFLEIPGPTRRVFHPRYDEEDYPDAGLQFGSAERDPDDNEDQVLVAGSNQAISSAGASSRGGTSGHTSGRGGHLSSQNVPGPLSPSTTAIAHRTRISVMMIIVILVVRTELKAFLW